MKSLTFSLTALFATLAAATPTPTVNEAPEHAHLAKRAGISDAANIGFATLNGGTKGGSGGTVTTVSSLAQFTAAVDEKNTSPVIVVVKGTISGDVKVRVGSNKSIIGLPGATLNGVSLHFRRQSNLILRNIRSTNVKASTGGDALKIEESTNVWVDHCDFSSTLNSDKDFYDGLVDSSHGSDFITISHTRFHDHWKASLVGHSDSNGDEDRGRLKITYANNYWKDVNSRAPLLRFGTAHVYNSYYENLSTAVNTRMGAQALVQNSVFRNVASPILSIDSKEVGYAVSINNDFGGGAGNTAPQGNLNPNSLGYTYSLMDTASVASTVPNTAGANLTY